MKINSSMNKQKLEQLIQEYKGEHLADFLYETGFEENKRRLDEVLPHGDIFSECLQLGELRTSDNQKVLIVETKVTNDLSERSSRKKQFDIGKKILQQLQNYQAGLFVFYDAQGNFRLSLIHPIYQGTRRQFSSFKRYTYYVSPQLTNRTLKQQLLASNFSSLHNIREAFSVAKVTEDFFDDYRKLFEKLIQYIDSDDHFPGFADQKGIDHHDVAKKLLGQIAFLYFLQKKGWLGASKESKIDAGDKNFMRSLFQKYQVEMEDRNDDEEFNFFNNYLEYLFYDTLNQESEYSANLYRQRFDCQIPYLDGGLFEPIPGYKWQEKFLKIPDEIFSNSDQTGVLDIFDRYNFTIDENSADDQEVSVDPEMLGKVFEKLLDTRNQTGAFYTPREIVAYMVKRSLSEHLRIKTTVDPEVIEEIVFTHNLSEEKIDNKSLTEINNVLQTVTIIDPAVGSGAFPLGILQELAAIRSFCLQQLGGNAPTLYELKTEILENNMYGVDINHGAIDIARLRFWLSLVVDANIDEVKPLPNLEFKLTAANSLYKIVRPQNDTGNVYDDPELLEKMSELRQKYFRARTAGSKQKIKENFEKLLNKSNNLFVSDTQRQITTYHPFDVSKNANFFDPTFMFGVEHFDIVIGNPPYVSTKGRTDEDKKLLEKNYDFVDDLYSHFFFRGYELATPGSGVVAYITSKTFWTIQTKRNLRQSLQSRKVLEIIDSANPFTAMVDTAITVLRNESTADSYEFLFKDGTENLEEPTIYTQNIVTYREAVNEVFFVPNDFNVRVYSSYNEKLKELQISWWEKIRTSRDITSNATELSEYRSSLKPGDVALLGTLTEGGQGLATANNGRFVGVRNGTTIADRTRTARAQKFFKKVHDGTIQGFQFRNAAEVEQYLDSLSEIEVWRIMDEAKEVHGRDVFGQGFLFRIVQDELIADVEQLSDEEKTTGIDGAKYFVPYDKGDKDGNRWWLETPYVIDWSKESVFALSTDPRARWQGYQFYFRNGFCWSDIHTVLIKSRLKANGVYDVKSMSMFSMSELVPDWFIVCLLNSTFISEYDHQFINGTSSFQINDARQVPVIVPTEANLSEFKEIFDSAYEIKRQQFASEITNEQAKAQLSEIQTDLDQKVLELYRLN